jgi:tetratricopeptide (TPR) repeat protein
MRMSTRPRALVRSLCVAIVAFALNGVALAAAEAQDDMSDTERLELAARLTSDGEYERAARALGKVDTTDEDLDLAKYHTVAGLIAISQNRNEDAIRNLNDAVAAGQADPTIQIYLAQSYFALERWPEALAALDAAGETANALGSVWQMRAHAWWAQGQRQQALDTLTRAADRFPANNSFTRRQVFYLIEAGLYEEAAELGRKFLTRGDVKADDYAAIGGALRRTKRYDEALVILESARLRFPDSDAIAKALSQTYLEDDQPLAAARLLEAAAQRDPNLLVETAELYRRAGYGALALSLNARVPDQAKKLKQRIGILVQLKRYGEVTGMESALHRSGVLEDEDVRYALAYAYFRAGDFAAADRHLGALKRPELFRKATELRKVMEECADAPWSCA